MDLVQIAKDFFAAVESQDWEKVSDMLTDDFRYWGATPGPVSKRTWLEFQQAVQKAIPDWSYNLSQVEQNGDYTTVAVRITGTHLADLVLPLHSLRPIPPTKNKIQLPTEHATLAFKNGKITELRVESVPHGGITGILEQLEVNRK